MRLLDTQCLETILGSMDLFHLKEGPNQKVHMDFDTQDYARYKTRESSGPVNTITAVSPEGAWLDIWWVYSTIRASEHVVTKGGLAIFRIL